MSEVTIRWLQTIAGGRYPGLLERVEETDFITACVKYGRLEIVERHGGGRGRKADPAPAVNLEPDLGPVDPEPEPPAFE